ncbi:MAG: ABC transporter permease [Omnitrophica WOR_2 bacterium]
MAGNREFQMYGTVSWLGGFPNLLKNENRRWWGTRLWLIQFLLFLVIVNGVVFVVYRTPVEEMYGPDSENASQAEQAEMQTMKQKPELIGLIPYMRLAGLVMVVGVVVVTQSALISEKQSGTAAWILSKPVSRSAFVLSKVAGYGLGIFGVMCVLLGAVLYGQIWLTTGVRIPLLLYAGMLSLVFLNLLFYLTLTILLGALFNSRGAVLGIPFILLFGYMLIPGIPAWLAQIMPWNLLDTLAYPALALTVVQGQPLPTLTPILATIISCVLFTVLALWKFNREEF